MCYEDWEAEQYDCDDLSDDEEAALQADSPSYCTDDSCSGCDECGLCHCDGSDCCDEPEYDEPDHPDVGPPGSGAVIIEYTGFEPGLEDPF